MAVRSQREQQHGGGHWIPAAGKAAVDAAIKNLQSLDVAVSSSKSPIITH